MDHTILGKRVARHIVAVALGILILAMASVSYLALTVFERHLTPEIQKKVRTVAGIISVDFQYALGFDIPLKEMRGVNEYLRSAIQPHQEVKYAAFVDPAGELMFGSHLTHPGDQSPVSGVRESVVFDAAMQQHFKHSAQAESGGYMQRVSDYLDLTFPVRSMNVLHGYLHLGIDADFIRDTLSGVLVDVLITLFVSVLITLEVLFLLLTLTVLRPVSLLNKLLISGQNGDFTRYGDWRSKDELGNLIATVNRVVQDLNQRFERLAERTRAFSNDTGLGAGRNVKQSIAAIQERYRLGAVSGLKKISEVSARDIRLPLFVYLFGTELSRSFFPIYVKDLYQPIPYLSESMVIALPMSIWVVAMIIATPFGSGAIRNYGIKTVLLWAMLVTAVGLFFTGNVHGVYDLLFWRCVTAAGFGVVTIAALLHIAAVSEKGRRARGMGVFVGAMVAASVCGSSIGGILAKNVGFGPTFHVAAGLVVIGCILVVLFLENHPQRDNAATPAGKTTPGSFARLLFGSRGSLLILFSAIPARIMLTGFLFYLTPLYLASLQFDPAVIGRMMMCYFLVMYLASPVVAGLADTYRYHRVLLVLGGVFSGFAALAFGFSTDTWVLTAGIACVGLGQSLVTTPQFALIPIVFAADCERYGAGAILAQFRIVERIGSIGGPLLCAALVGTVGFAAASTVIAVGMVVFAVCLLLFLGLRRTQVPDAET